MKNRIEVTRKSKPLKKTLAWALVDDHGRLWLDDDNLSDVAHEKKTLIERRKTYMAPHVWRIVRVEIKEVTPKKGKRK